MNNHSHPNRRRLFTAMMAAALSVLVLPGISRAQGKKSKPASKIYVSAVRGEAQIRVGDKIVPLTAKSAYDATGIAIETAAGASVTLVFSNGTSVSLDSETRIEVKRFEQEPFTPTRNDFETEPSISHLQVTIAHGNVSVSTSKLVAGSSMTFQTPQGLINVLGGKVVIGSTDSQTVVSVLEGSGTTRAGSLAAGGQTLRAGDTASIHSTPAGESTQTEITRISPTELTKLDDKVAVASMAKKTVYFEVRERSVDTAPQPGAAGPVAIGGDSAGGSKVAADRAVLSGPVTAFDSNSATTSNTGSGTGNTTVREIVSIPVVPVNLPVQFTVSPATITSSAANRPGG